MTSDATKSYGDWTGNAIAEIPGPGPYNEKNDLEARPSNDNAPHVVEDKLARRLSARQVQMIAIGGTIGTGLFLGTGKSLAIGGPGSILIAYLIVGCIVFVTMLSLGEMAAFIPVAGSFCTFAGRFVDDAFAFALTWNYWFNDAVSMASDLVCLYFAMSLSNANKNAQTALQLVLDYWKVSFPGYAVSLIFWVALISVNLLGVRYYGELEYWLSLLKVITIIIFIILGIVVNAGGNTFHTYIGGQYWMLDDAPFVGGIGGFASVFVTASFACRSSDLTPVSLQLILDRWRN